MAAKPTKLLRCAIYTRKSTEHGLELEFNSLHAQREACEAYIKSQASEGWRASSQRYDDPAYSGGNMDRPALKKLLKDIDSRLVDVVVVYKIDRLTRALADFAKLVEVFDARSVSFVAVTQQFNTTTSMGRLTLNVLLSFAQFERELSSERVRDKIAASRRKGKWTGGTIPLGYDCKDKKLVINDAEARTVRMIFERYLALGSIQRLINDLDRDGILTKRQGHRQRVAGGIPFQYGTLAYLLKNRTYLGEMGHKGSWFEGEHEAIVDRYRFDNVQSLMKSNAVDRVHRGRESPSLLSGILFDDRGNRMTPSFSTKNGVRYRFYVSAALLRGRKADAGSVSRVSATDIEDLVLEALRDRNQVTEQRSAGSDRDLIDLLARVEIYEKSINVKLKMDTIPAVDIPWSRARRRHLARIEENPGGKSAPEPHHLQALARAHSWLRDLTNGTFDSVEALAQSAGLHPKVVRNGIRLAFLSPLLTEQIIQGGLHRTISLNEASKSLPMSWKAQKDLFVSEPAI